MVTRAGTRVLAVSLKSVSQRSIRQRLNSTSPSSSSRSSSFTSPSSKICSVPFRQTPQDALNRLHIYGLIASASLSNIFYAGLLRLFGTSIEPIAKELKLGETLKLKDMKAALYPIWRVDAIAEGRVTPSSGGREAKGWMAAREAYVPGNPFAPLSYLSYSVPPFDDDLPIYDPEVDLAQLGEGFEVVPVPFTVSPIKFAEKLRSKIGRRADLEGIRFDEKEWQEKMLACYPIMFPIYIAEFEAHTTIMGNEQDWSFTMIMDAHDPVLKNCRVSFPPPPGMRKKSVGRFDSNYYVNPAPFMPMFNFILGLPPSESSSPLSLTSTIASAYQSWMSPPPGPAYIPPSPTLDASVSDPSELPWDDVRIQSWSSVEREENGAYMEKGLEVYKNIAAVETMAAITSNLPRGDYEDGNEPQAMVVSLGSLTQGKGPSITRKPVKEMKSEMEEMVKNMKMELEEYKPEWLKEWEKSQDQNRVEKKTN